MPRDEQTTTEAPLLTTAEVASRLRVNPMTVRRLIKGGDLPAFQVGRDFRIDPADLDKLLHRSRTRCQ